MFIFSLPLLFQHMQLGSPLELAGIALFLFGLLLLSAPGFQPLIEQEANRSSQQSNAYHILIRAWTGNLKLWHVFWPFFIALNCSLFAVDLLAKQSQLSVSSWDEIHFILLTPVIFWSLAVWKNSIHCQYKLAIAAARLSCLAVFFEYGLKLYIRIDYPRLFFACHELMLNYKGCF